MQNRHPCEEFDPGLSCAFQRSATRFENQEPETCAPTYHDWGRVQDDFEYWEMDRQNYESAEANRQRDRRGYKTCKHRYGELNGKRF